LERIRQGRRGSEEERKRGRDRGAEMVVQKQRREPAEV